MDSTVQRPTLTASTRRALPALRWVALGAFVVLAGVVWTRDGIPLERFQVLLWVLAGLFIATVGHPGRGPVAILRDWVPIGVVLAGYDLSRGVADGLGMPVQMESTIAVEKVLAFGQVPTVWSQSHLGPYDGPVRWWEIPVALVYTSHFVLPFVVMAWLWARDHDRFRHYRNALLALTALGLITFVLLPTAPPWLASNRGAIGPVERVGLRGYQAFGLHTAHTLVVYGSTFGNAVAALPSLHAGWSTLTALWFARSSRRRWWPLLFAYPLVMGVSLVISGEHYVVDVLLGYLYAGAVIAAIGPVRGWWAGR